MIFAVRMIGERSLSPVDRISPSADLRASHSRPRVNPKSRTVFLAIKARRNSRLGANNLYPMMSSQNGRVAEQEWLVTGRTVRRTVLPGLVMLWQELLSFLAQISFATYRVQYHDPYPGSLLLRCRSYGHIGIRNGFCLHANFIEHMAHFFWVYHRFFNLIIAYNKFVFF